MRRGVVTAGLLSIMVMAGACQTPQPAPTPPPVFSTRTTRVSVSSLGAQASSDSGDAALSADGRDVVFTSVAVNLVPGDTNGVRDVFVRDQDLGTTTRVSVAGDGTQGDRESFSPGISPDGRYVTFGSWSTNLAPGDTNRSPDLFVRDLVTGTVTRIQLDADPAPPATPTAGPSVIPLPPPDPVLLAPAAMSADDRYIAFASDAPGLVPGDTNLNPDVFVYDRDTATTSRVSLAPGGAQADHGSGSPSISDDGRYVAFSSFATNLVPGDTNGTTDVFVHDRDTGATTLVSVATDGTRSNGQSDGPELSADGRHVTFSSTADNLVPADANGVTDVFVHDLDTGVTNLASVATDGSRAVGPSYDSSISGDGRYVAFMSSADNLAPTDPALAAYDRAGTYDIFVHDQLTGSTSRVSAISGPADWQQSFQTAISSNGRHIAFASNVPYLVPHDNNANNDVFVFDRGT